MLCLVFCAAGLFGCHVEIDAPKYSVTFYADGAEVGKTTSAGNERIELPDAPEKTGYDFIGWFFGEEEGAEQFFADTYAQKPLTGNISVYARYRLRDTSVQEYTITFYAEGAEVGKTTSAGNEKITLPAAPQKPGYTFGGWYFDENTWLNPVNEDTYLHTALTGDVSVYAKYTQTPAPEPQEYTITFYAEGAEVGKTTSAGNEKITLPAAPQKPGYTFVGWYFDENTWLNPVNEDTYLHTALTGDVSVYAKYTQTPAPEPQEYTITFYADGQKAGTFVTAGNEKITLPAAPEKPGYTFVGWYFDENTWLNPVNEDTYLHSALTGDVSVYAKYTQTPAPEYTVTFDTRGGSDIPPKKFTAIESEAALPVPQRAGFTFTGWYLDSACGTPVKYPYTLTGDVTLYAGWKSQGIRFLVDASGALTGVEGAEGAFSLEIPEKVGNVTVTSIAGGAFSGTGIVSVRIPATVRYIGGESFMNCKDLSTVVFEEGVTTIQESAFEGCVSLKKIVFPDSLLQIRSDAFSGSGLTGLSLNKVREVWQYAFKNCAALVSLDLGEVREIGESAFEGCALRSVTLPDTLQSTGGNIFANCAGLSSVSLPESGVPIRSNAFYNTACEKKAEEREDGVVLINGYAFGANENLTGVRELTLPEDTVCVADGAFQASGNKKNYVIALEKVILPQGLKRLGAQVFSGCSSLASVEVRGSLVSVGEKAFEGTALYQDTTGENWYGGGLYIGNWLVAVSKSVSGDFVVKDGTEYIIDIDSPNRLFPTSALNKITSVTLPSSLRRIGNNAFKSLSKITSIELPAGLESIGENAFSGCIALASVNLGDCASLREIGTAALMQCAFEKITVPASVQTMGYNVFNQNSANLVVYCEAASKPAGWSSDWDVNYKAENDRVTVEWGRKQP